MHSKEASYTHESMYTSNVQTNIYTVQKHEYTANHALLAVYKMTLAGNTRRLHKASSKQVPLTEKTNIQ